jgi:hypothetical protein
MRHLLVGLAALLGSACATQGVEEPAFSLVRAEGDFEIRTYAPVIVAETTLRGDSNATLFAGFGPLADYIFAKGREGEKIAMTAPVSQRPRDKIAMTAPVTQQKTSDDAWTIGFTMPAGYTIDTLPAPVNPDVKLVELPARTMAVLRFSGAASDSTRMRAQQTLLARIAAQNLKPTGEPEFAYYDPPWTLPFFRRNEVMVQVADAR